MNLKKGTSAFLALAAVLITVVSVWYTQRPVALQKTTWEDVIAEAGAGGYRIITTDTLADRHRKDRSGMLLVDTRQEWEYHTGHIEGALNFSMEPTWWARWRKFGDLEEFLGPDKHRILIFY